MLSESQQRKIKMRQSHHTTTHTQKDKSLGVIVRDLERKGRKTGRDSSMQNVFMYGNITKIPINLC